MTGLSDVNDYTQPYESNWFSLILNPKGIDSTIISVKVYGCFEVG